MNMSSTSFKFRNAKGEEIYMILINIDPNKAYCIDEIPGRLLKDGVELLTEPLRKIINLYIKLYIKNAKIGKRHEDSTEELRPLALRR